MEGVKGFLLGKWAWIPTCAGMINMEGNGTRLQDYSDVSGGYGGGDVINGVWYMR